MSSSSALAGRKVLVTGSGTGIGKGVALECAREGADVAFHYAHSNAGALEAVAEVQALGVRAAAFGGDFADVGQARRVAREAIAFLGGLDVLINNAGITMNRPFEKVTVEQFDTLFHVNIRAMFFVTQECLPALIASGRGIVINMTSVHAFEAYCEHTVYASTKGAIVSFTRNLAIELAPRGVRVNAIAPGAVIVENHYKVSPDLDPEAVGRGIPIGFAGQPRDIARACIFLATDDARYNAMPILGRNPRIRFAGAPDCRARFAEAGIAQERVTILRAGETAHFAGFSLTGTYADHGDLAPEAIGVILQAGDIRVWQVGDSAYRPDRWQDICAQGVDVLIPPINGAFGNLNGMEAALLARACRARVAIPCHFWMFAERNGDPARFLEAMREHAPETTAHLMAQGECLVIGE